ncbi:hypothetical protein Cni_G15755 [Canna indica]|uniref:Auxin-responsive protein SAUR32 n=1 Tax=Canna indica TaxID=4628 RepID=A0AAQ3QG37_9LILI|nr:hypothetical protein Cni_G15755 [Canna indica]
MPHRERTEKTAGGMPPKGFVAVWVGQEGEKQRRFVVPVEYVSHPLFAELLETAAAEYGYSQKGAIVIPCGVEQFRRVHDIIDRERGGGHHHHHYHHHHHLLPHLAGCFGA